MSKKEKLAYLWVELFRPKKIADIILPTKYKRTFNRYVKNKEIPHLILYSSSPGVGKTTLAKALCAEMDADKLYINASKNGGIDTLRDTIARFASSRSIVKDRPKIVIMDEADGCSPSLQKGLRAFTEEFHMVCRFIFTANYITQIIEPLQDRCQVWDMNFLDKKTRTEMIPKIQKRVEGILKYQKVEFKKDVVTKLIENSYPSIRKVIKLCQQYSDINGNIDHDIFNYEKVDSDFYDHIVNKEFGKARKYALDKGYNYDEMFTNLYREYVPMLSPREQPQAILTIAKFAYKNAFMVDKEINFSALLLELMGADDD